MSERIKVFVNAIPLTNVNTGVSRYLKCLYTEMERLYSAHLEIGYFDGAKVSSTMPSGPNNLKRWFKLVDYVWKLPLYPALLIRLMMHYKREVIVRKYIKDFDIYHEAGFFPFSSPRRIKTVFTVHDLSVIRFPEYHPRERVLYFRLFLRPRCRNVNHFLTVSQFSKTEMQACLKIDPKITTVTHLAHDPGVFYPRTSGNIRASLNGQKLPEEYFLFVGTGDPRKNLDIIPKALEKSGLKIPLVVVGWYGWADKKAWDNVIFLGYISDDGLAEVYSNALALILPSSYEGFGLPLLEAMACGCPVITARRAGLPEVAGEAALFIENGRDVESLANLLTDFSSDERIRKALVQKGKRRAARFSWEKTARKTYEVFHQVLVS